MTAFGWSAEDGRLIVSDGLAGMRMLTNVEYDAVVIDCMVQGVIPPGCKSAEFVRRVAKHTRPSGHVTQWAWGADRTLLKAAYAQHFYNVSETPFGGIGGVLHVRGKKPRDRVI